MKIKRKFAIVLCLLLSLALLSACGGEQTPAASPDAVSEPVQAEDTSQFAFTYKDTAITPGAPMEPVLEQIGEPQNLFEAPSCAFDGEDKIYYYPGFIINTYPDNGADYILSLSFQDDNVQTAEGLRLGMSEADITAAYGEGDWNDAKTQLSYSSNGTSLAFLLDSGSIISINYIFISAQNAVDAAA